MHITVLSGTYSVCRLTAAEPIPAWVEASAFFAVAKTMDELSVVCEARCVPSGVQSEADWRILKVEGPLDFSLVGILAALAGALAAAGISIFAVSTYDTDYLLVKENKLDAAITVLRENRHTVRE
ncbi:MAG: ACT domain-containing protein [bacterium]